MLDCRSTKSCLVAFNCAQENGKRRFDDRVTPILIHTLAQKVLHPLGLFLIYSLPQVRHGNFGVLGEPDIYVEAQT